MTEKDGHEKSHVELARSLIELLPRSAGGLAATLILVLIVLVDFRTLAVAQAA